MISLIISTYNRASSLNRSLQYIANVEATDEWELIVVDNASTDQTRSIVDDFAQTVDFPVRYIYEARRGLGNARNAGVSAARGEICIFTDDDCYVDKLFLTATLQAFTNDRVGYATGRIMLYDPEDCRVTINESLVRKFFSPFSYIPPGEIKGANMAFRTSVLVEIGGFDGEFGSGASFPAEDCDAVARASLSGWAGVYEPAICVQHHHGRKAEHLPKLYRDYDYGRGAYHAKLLFVSRRRDFFLRIAKGVARRAVERPYGLFWEAAGFLSYTMRAVRKH